jgi:release factor glutamine methyltransferase
LPTISQAISEAAHILQTAAVPDERLTASALLCHLLSLDRTQLFIKSDELLSEEQYQAFLTLVERRAAGEPLQYIIGHQEFYGLDFKVTPDVLIPRPETEFLVEQVIKFSKSIHQAAEIMIADIGTGSGCIAVTLAKHIEKARVFATDISPAALAVAKENAERNGVTERIEFLAGDVFAPFAGRGLEASFDFIASNPPYVGLQDAGTLQREVRDWEPHTALFAGEDGLLFYQRLLNDGKKFVKRGGYLVCEIGFTQLDAISRMIDANDWQLSEVTNDLQGIPRTLTIRRIK